MIVLDTEIIAAPVSSDKRKDGYKYANGWEDYIGMGISVCVIYDYKTNQYYEFTESILNTKHNEMQSIIDNAEIICGFNHIKFDVPLLEAHGFNFSDKHLYDILLQLWFAAGLNKNYNPKTHGGYSLNAVCKNNLDGAQKNGSGADAPILWQDGKYNEVIQYCRNDVKLTKDLLDLIFMNGGLISPRTKKYCKMAIPSKVGL